MSLAEQFAKQDASCGTELPRYRCHKEVWAVKIKSIEVDDSQVYFVNRTGQRRWLMQPEDPGYGVIELSREFMFKHQPKAGGYLVVYKDGYQSFSPAEAFEEGYTRI